MLLPEFTYHVIRRFADGDTYSTESNLTRDDAFDAAADFLTAWPGGSVMVMKIQHSLETGGPVGIVDCTASMYSERPILMAAE